MSYNPTISANVDVNESSYRVELDTDSDHVTIFRRDGEGCPLIWLGTGIWRNGRIDDCPANLGDEVYEALDEALNERLVDADEDLFVDPPSYHGLQGR